MAEQRIQKVLSDQGVCSRRAAEKLIDEGRVKVNGHPVTLGDKMDPDFDKVSIDGKSVRIVRKRQYTYLMLNKPRGYITTASDERGRKTVMDLLTGVDRRVYPIGRLDKDSEGLLLLTDDGGFAHDILAPKRHVSKTYTVTLDTPLTEEMRTGFAAGVTLADGTALSPAEVTALSPDGLTVRVVLKQGVYHQIKRMFGVYGAGVNGLHRDAIGGLALDENLAPGQWRELSDDEVAEITRG